MNYTHSSPATEPILLQEEQTRCADLTVTYRLFAMRVGEGTGFLISAETATNSCDAELSVPLSVALARFQTVTEGKVLPCTLRDVLADLQYLENF